MRGVLKKLLPETKLLKKNEHALKFVSGDQKGRVSIAGTVLPIWIADSFKPASLRSVGGVVGYLRG